MVRVISQPTVIKAAGNKPKQISELIGRVNSGTNAISIAKMNSPEGWSEPFQTPEFAEYTIVLKGILEVETNDESYSVSAGQAIITDPGERIRYSTPAPGGAEYIAICLPAFSPEKVHRDTAN
jgi:mannose-6-phosphate isomerase-like protein (cupin superfamily)